MGGAERLTLQLAQAMAARGHAVRIVVLRGWQKDEWKPTGVEVIYLNLGKSLCSLPAALLRARRQLTTFHPEIIHAHTFFANLFARLLRCLCPALVISTVHNVYEGGSRRMMAYRLTDPLCRLTVAICTVAAERYVRLKAVPRRKCRVVLNAIDPREFQPDAGRRAVVRAQLGASGFLWLAAGRVSPAKDYPTLLRAFSLVRRSTAEAQLWIAGGQAVNLSLAERTGPDLAEDRPGVRWLGLQQDMAGLLDAADGFVLSSAWEGMPLALAEAMAMEKPVVATHVGGVPELLGEEGTLVPPGDPEQLAQAMRTWMVASAELRAAQGRRARKRIEERFDLGPWLAKWEAIYGEIASSRSR